MTGLDQRTVQHMLHSLFSSDGMLKKNKHTVVLATTSGMTILLHNLLFFNHAL